MRWAGALVQLCCGLALAAPAAAGCAAARVGELPLTVWHTRLFVPLSVNGTAGNFLLDTGAAHSVIDEGFAARAGVQWDRHQPVFVLSGFGGETLPVRAGHLRMLDFAGMEVPDREMPMHDFSGVPAPDGGAIAGLLGADLLDLFDVELDPAAGKLALWRLAGCHDIAPLHWTGDYASIPMRRTGDKQLKIPIWLDGADLEATLDTGAPDLYLSRAAALQAGATSQRLAQDPLIETGGIAGVAPRRRHRFDMLLVGRDEYHNVHALVSEAPPHGGSSIDQVDALLGLPILLGHRVWLSYGTGTLFLQKLPEYTPRSAP